MQPSPWQTPHCCPVGLTGEAQKKRVRGEAEVTVEEETK